MYTHSYVSRIVLPIASRHRIAPNTPTPVAARVTEGLDIEKIYISMAGTKGGAADWVVHDLLVDGRSQFRHKDLPGFLFSVGSLGGVPRSSSTISFDGLDVVGQGQEVALVVSYVGPNPEGGNFIGSVVGSSPGAAPSVLAVATTHAAAPKRSVKVSARLQTAPFRLERIVIEGDASAWVVSDLMINGRSQFSQAGDVPGDMFASSVIDGFVSMDTCLAGNAIEVIATYIGEKPEGERFVARYEGAIAAFDEAKPPELRALVSSSLDDREDAPREVVATISPRARSRQESIALAQRESVFTLGGDDLIEQCSVLVTSRSLDRIKTVIEARLVSAPDPELGRKLCFFAAMPDGKRAEIAPSAVDMLIRLDATP